MVFDAHSGISTSTNRIGFGKKKVHAPPPDPSPPGPSPPAPKPPGPNIDDITGHELFLPISIGVLSFIALIVLFCCCKKRQKMQTDQTFRTKHFGEMRIGTIAESDEGQSGCCFKKKKATI